MATTQGTGGAPTIGSMISEFTGPGIPRILHKAGFEFAIVDTEHGAFSFADLAVMAASARALSFALLVRVPSISREHIGRVLDLGADGIVVPMVNSPAEADAAVKLAKYAPVGERGVSVTRAHADYGVEDLPRYFADTNERIKVYVQVETPEGVDNAGEIATISGISGIVFGPNDYLQALGVPGEFDNLDLDRALRTVAQAADAAQVESGVISSNAALLTRSAALGMSLLSYDSELGHLIKGASAALARLRDDVAHV